MPTDPTTTAATVDRLFPALEELQSAMRALLRVSDTLRELVHELLDDDVDDEHLDAAHAAPRVRAQRKRARAAS